jgi:hypothetical protein
MIDRAVRWGVIVPQTVLAVCLFFQGCATDKVAWDLVNYVNQDILGISELERRPLERYALVRKDRHATDQSMFKVLKEDVIPEYRRFLHLLKQIEPETKEVRKLHYIYIRGTECIYKGFKIKMAGLERKDEIIIWAANEEIERGRIKNENWRRELLALFEAHGIECAADFGVPQGK